MKPALAASNEIRIEKGVPLPERSPTRRYPFPAMEIGDSILIPVGRDDVAERRRILTASHNWAKMNNRHHVNRTVDGGVRIWRTA